MTKTEDHRTVHRCAHCGGYGGMLCGITYTDGRYPAGEWWTRCFRCAADTNMDGSLRALAPMGWGDCSCVEDEEDGGTDSTGCAYHRTYDQRPY